MTQCNTLNVKLSSSQLNKLRSQIKNGTEVTLNLLSNVIGNFNDFFFLSGLSFTDTDNSQDSRGREGTFFNSTLPLPPAHENSDIYVQLCT